MTHHVSHYSENEVKTASLPKGLVFREISCGNDSARDFVGYISSEEGDNLVVNIRCFNENSFNTKNTNDEIKKSISPKASFVL